MLSSSMHCVRLNDQITGGDYRHLTISVALASPFSNPLLPRQRTPEAPNRGQARHTHVSAAAVACLLRRPGQVPAQLRALFCSVPGGDEIRSPGPCIETTASSICRSCRNRRQPSESCWEVNGRLQSCDHQACQICKFHSPKTSQCSFRFSFNTGIILFFKQKKGGVITCIHCRGNWE